MQILFGLTATTYDQFTKSFSALTKAIRGQHPIHVMLDSSDTARDMEAYANQSTLARDIFTVHRDTDAEAIRDDLLTDADVLVMIQQGEAVEANFLPDLLGHLESPSASSQPHEWGIQALHSIHHKADSLGA